MKLRSLRPYMKKLMPERYIEIENMIRSSETELKTTAIPYLLRVKHTLYSSELKRQCRRR